MTMERRLRLQAFSGRAAIRAATAALFTILLSSSLALVAGCGAQAAGSPAQIVRKAMSVQGELKSVHMRLDSELDFKVPGTQRTATVSYDGVYEKPDRWRLKLITSGAKSEVIILGDRTLVKLPGSDSWTEKKSGALDGGSSPGSLVSSKYLGSASNIVLADKKGDAYHLNFDLDLAGFARTFNVTGVDPSVFKGKRAHMEVWVQRDSMRIEKATMNFSGDLSATGTPGALSMDMEVDFSDFNEPVSIEPPAPGAP